MEVATVPTRFVDAPDDRVPELFASQADVEDWEALLVSQDTQAIIVRNGIHYGIPMEAWLALYHGFASEY